MWEPSAEAPPETRMLLHAEPEPSRSAKRRGGRRRDMAADMPSRDAQQLAQSTHCTRRFYQ
eukprot:5329040-Prymnesium_polylepis.1